MSGGHFNYNQHFIRDISDEVEQLIFTNDDDTLDRWGECVGRGYAPEIIEKFKEALVVLRKAEAMAQRIDWLVSGDDGDESFLKRWDEELAKLHS